MINYYLVAGRLYPENYLRKGVLRTVILKVWDGLSLRSTRNALEFNASGKLTTYWGLVARNTYGHKQRIIVDIKPLLTFGRSVLKVDTKRSIWQRDDVNNPTER